MVRARTIALAAALAACRAAAPAAPVRAPVAAPAPVAATPAAPAGPEVSVAAGADSVCELRRDGTVWCRGHNTVGQLGDGTREAHGEPRRVEGLAGATQLASSAYTVCALTGEGRVLRWGMPVDRPTRPAAQDAVLTPEALAFGAAAEEVAVTRSAVCARLRRGGVACLGAGSPGVVEVDSLREAASLVATADDVCARLRGGGLRCVRGDGGVVDVPEGEGARAVVGAVNALVIQRADGAVVRVVASPANGALRSAVVVDEARDATALWGSAGGWCYARAQRLWCQGVHENSPVGGHGVQGATLDVLPVAGLRGARSAAVGIRFACAIGEGDDAPRCWGVGPHLFTSEPGHREQLVPPGGAALGSVVDLVTRGHGSCALMERDAPRCWGRNEHRALLGVGRLASAIAIPREAYGAPVEAMAWHGALGCAVSGGALRCVVAEGRYNPVQGVPGLRVRAPDRVVSPTLPAAARSVAVAPRVACASLVDGRVACAPREAFGATSSDAPPAFELVPGLAEVARVVARGQLLCALSDTRPAQCWGDAPEWDMLPAQSEAPVALPQLGPIRSVAAGEHHACAADVRGAVWCWGRGRAGQLGAGVFSERARPGRVPLAGEAQEVAVGSYHSCARVGGSLWCWGGNARGQLGDGTTAMRAAPVRVAGLEGVTRVVADGERTCALSGDRRVYCWGAGAEHGLGNGEARDRHEPTPVRGE